MVADGTYLLWDLLIFHVYRRCVRLCGSWRGHAQAQPTRLLFCAALHACVQ
jgi:hypothetical protein